MKIYDYYEIGKLLKVVFIVVVFIFLFVIRIWYDENIFEFLNIIELYCR